MCFLHSFKGVAMDTLPWNNTQRYFGMLSVYFKPVCPACGRETDGLKTNEKWRKGASDEGRDGVCLPQVVFAAGATLPSPSLCDQASCDGCDLTAARPRCLLGREGKRNVRIKVPDEWFRSSGDCTRVIGGRTSHDDGEALMDAQTRPWRLRAERNHARSGP